MLLSGKLGVLNLNEGWELLASVGLSWSLHTGNMDLVLQDGKKIPMQVRLLSDEHRAMQETSSLLSDERRAMQETSILATLEANAQSEQKQAEAAMAKAKAAMEQVVSAR